VVKKNEAILPSSQLVLAEHGAGNAVVLSDTIKLSLYKKSKKSGFDVDTLEEVFLRGYKIARDSGRDDQLIQEAFSRVNSFIAGGAAAEMDKDLTEGKRGLWDNIWAKRRRGERMRKPGEKGSPTEKELKLAREEHQLDEAAESALAKKAKKSGVSLGILKKVYRRGVAAWNSGHRPGTTPQQWGMARVNSYITKGKGTYHGADKDLREDSRINKEPYHRGLSAETAKARVAHWKKMDKLSDKDPRSYEPAPGDATAKTIESKHTKKYKEMYGEEFVNAEPRSNDPNNPASRFDGDARVYIKSTPGQESAMKNIGGDGIRSKRLKTIKKVVREFQEVCEGCDCHLSEAKYQGREVPLNKPMQGDVKKSKVYVRDPSTGNIKKVNFGDKTLSIKKNIPARKRSYCARSSGQGNLTDKTKANYWSRRAWDC